MCGIAGFLTSEGKQPERELLRRMCDTLAHRGPDGFGSWFGDQVALGHRRLSIIDLATGAQPLSNEDQTVWITFNGEIYNYLELRGELISRGHVFRTGSDTEVIVHLYEEFGERLAERLNGMFAFAIWDTRRQELLIARDRLGKKPIYYQAHEGREIRFTFASELKALREVPDFDATVNSASVADFLSFGYVPDPQTIYAGVSKLPAGHTMTISRVGLRMRQYWKPAFTADEGRNEKDTAEEINALANDATRQRMISDVPLGAFLSGGVDSSAVVGWMASSGVTVKSFSIGFTSQEHDELKYARVIAAQYHTEHYERVVTPSIEEVFGTFVEAFDEPFGDSSAIPTLYLSRMAREKVTVALNGDGADEVFAGYRLYAVALMEDRIRTSIPAWFRKGLVGPLGNIYPKLDFLPRMFRAKSLMTNVGLDLPEAHFNSRAYLGTSLLGKVLSRDLTQDLGGYSPRDKMHQWFSEVANLHPLEQMQAVDMRSWLPSDILVKADRATMAFSLEARSPLLDYRLVELAGRLPQHYKVRDNQTKYILKKAVASLVPSELITRPKMGFSVPMKDWMKTSLKPVFEALVLRKEMAQFFDLSNLGLMWKQHQSGLSNHDRRLWALLAFAAWHVRWVEGKSDFGFSRI